MDAVWSAIISSLVFQLTAKVVFLYTAVFDKISTKDADILWPGFLQVLLLSCILDNLSLGWRNVAGFLSCGGSCKLSVQSEVFIALLWDTDFRTAELQADFSLFLLCENWVNFVSLCIKKRLVLMMECNSFYRTFFSSLFSSLFWFTISWCDHSLLASVIYDYATCSCHPLVSVCIATGPSRFIQI